MQNYDDVIASQREMIRRLEKQDRLREEAPRFVRVELCDGAVCHLRVSIIESIYPHYVGIGFGGGTWEPNKCELLLLNGRCITVKGSPDEIAERVKAAAESV